MKKINRYWSKPQIAERLGVTSEAVHYWILNGYIEQAEEKCGKRDAWTDEQAQRIFAWRALWDSCGRKKAGRPKKGVETKIAAL